MYIHKISVETTLTHTKCTCSYYGIDLLFLCALQNQISVLEHTIITYDNFELKYYEKDLLNLKN